MRFALAVAACLGTVSCSVPPSAPPTAPAPEAEAPPAAPTPPSPEAVPPAAETPAAEEKAAPKPLPPAPAPALPFLRAAGTRIVDEEGNPVLLRGCNLGNWLLLEMWMMDWRELRDQHELETLLARRFGPQEKDRLLDVFRENWIRDRDFQIIRQFGFNTVRVPFHYSLLEDDARPFELKPDAFRWLDRAVQMAARHGCYVILDLHGAPGGQSLDHTTGRADQNRLWTDPEAQRRTVWLWSQIAARYRGNAAVAAYDLLNEPFGDGKTEAHQPALLKLMEEIYAAVRAVDPDHIVFFPATHAGLDFYPPPAERGWQGVGFTEHYYPGVFGSPPSRQVHAEFIARHLPWRTAFLETVQVPFLVGEFNVVFDFAGGPALMRRYYDLFASHGWAATMWTYKLVQRRGGLEADSWCMVKNRDDLPLCSPRTATAEELENYFRWLGEMEYSVNERLGAALTMADPPLAPLPPCEPMPVHPPAVDPLDGWEASDIGGALAGGQRQLSANALEIYGGGADVWGTRDQFRFVWRRVTGDFELSATVVSLAGSHLYAKAGLMLRAGLEPDAAHVLLHIFPDGEVLVGWRGARGEKMEQKTVAPGLYPARLRLVRRGDWVDASYSDDGRSWEKTSVRLSDAIGPTAYVGLAVLSHDNRCLTTARFEDIRFEPR